MYTMTTDSKMEVKGLDALPAERLRRLIDVIESTEMLNPQTHLEALELSLAKWHPSRGEDQGRGYHGEQDDAESCGLCMYWEGDCTRCVLVRCTAPHHPYDNWTDADRAENADAVLFFANSLYNMIYNAWLKETGTSMDPLNNGSNAAG